MSRRLDHEAP